MAPLQQESNQENGADKPGKPPRLDFSTENTLGYRSSSGSLMSPAPDTAGSDMAEPPSFIPENPTIFEEAENDSDNNAASSYRPDIITSADR